ncbi:UNVERIFIED_CONTAM: hypothetical protein FKN15_048070 [Acipenser sinensis]
MKTDTRVLQNVRRRPSASFHSADLPCSRLRAAASEDHAALGRLQAGPQTPGQTTGVTGARSFADVAPPQSDSIGLQVINKHRCCSRSIQQLIAGSTG